MADLEQDIGELKVALARLGSSFNEFMTEWREQQRALPYWELVRQHREHDLLLRGKDGTNGAVGRTRKNESRLEVLEDQVGDQLSSVDDKLKKMVQGERVKFDKWWQDPRFERVGIMIVVLLLASGYSIPDMVDLIGGLFRS